MLSPSLRDNGLIFHCPLVGLISPLWYSGGEIFVELDILFADLSVIYVLDFLTLKLDPDTVKTIQEKAKAKLDKKREQWFTPYFLSHLPNVTSHNILVNLKLFSVTNANQRKLVRSKMSNIFQPNIRRALNQNTSDSSKRIFGGDSNFINKLGENKKMLTLLKSVMLYTKKPGKVGKKPGTKGAKRAATGNLIFITTNVASHSRRNLLDRISLPISMSSFIPLQAGLS